MSSELLNLADEFGGQSHASAAEQVLRLAWAWQRTRLPEEQKSAAAREDLASILLRLDGDDVEAKPLLEGLAARTDRWDNKKSGIAFRDAGVISLEIF